jgi:hypothetical protein
MGFGILRRKADPPPSAKDDKVTEGEGDDKSMNSALFTSGAILSFSGYGCQGMKEEW